MPGPWGNGESDQSPRAGEKTQSEVPTVGRGAWVFRHHFIQSVINTHLMSSFPVPGPDPKSLGGPCLHVAAKLSCLSKVMIAGPPPAVRLAVSKHPHLHFWSRCPTPTCAPLCLPLWGCEFSSSGCASTGLPFLWPFSILPSVPRHLLVGLFPGTSVSTFLRVSCLSAHHRGPPGTSHSLHLHRALFSPLYNFLPSNPSPFPPFSFLFLPFNRRVHRTKYIFKIFLK